jgi:hypothetical protein
MKKQLNVGSIQSELRGGSAFFPGYKGSNSRVPSEPAPMPANVPEQPSVEANARSSVRPNGRRIITRNSFETYEDQMESLRKLSYREKMEGKVGSMSAMVRDAIDDYLKAKNAV